MSSKKKKTQMVKAINQRGCLLVYPLENRKEPASLWSELYPRTKMRWEWDQDGDNRVAEMWVLREELSRSEEVIYTKWFRNRATFFSKEVFLNMLAYLGSSQGRIQLPRSSQEALDSFLLDSPQSTKVIKENLGWQGKLMESHYNRAMKPLWSYLFLVGYGEVQDSSFPSLNMAAAQNLFEDLWLQSQSLDPQKAEAFLEKKLGSDNPFFKYAQKMAKGRSQL
ncbi:AlkZ-related protein [Bdellovibrio bacteriovorus]|uniref:AlkZ-related protein n=1 Tax=Bdellovibrio bacteriovorus TaxID=959 RepID=UPI0035A5D0E6